MKYFLFIVASMLVLASCELTELNNAPKEPSLPSPNNAATSVELTNVELYWYSTDADNDSISYTIYFGTTNPPTEKLIETTSNTYTIDSLAELTTYYWQVVANDNKKNGEVTGTVWSFKTIESPGDPNEVPHTPTPADGATGLRLSGMLQWECKNPNVDGYEVYMIKQGDTNPPLGGMIGGPIVTKCEYDAEPNTTYEWFVVGRNYKDQMDNYRSNTWTFTTGNGN